MSWISKWQKQHLCLKNQDHADYLVSECMVRGGKISQLNAAIQRVRHLHRRAVGGGLSVCDECRFMYPCPTIKALEGEQG